MEFNSGFKGLKQGYQSGGSHAACPLTNLILLTKMWPGSEQSYLLFKELKIFFAEEVRRGLLFLDGNVHLTSEEREH